MSGAALDLALDADPRILRDAASSVTSELNNLRQHRVALSIPPELSDLIRRIDDPIAAAAETGLSEDVIAILPKARITVSQLHEGLTRRKDELAVHFGPQRSLLEEIDEQIRSLDNRLSAIRQAEQYMEQVEIASKRLSNAEGRLRQALDAISVSGHKQYQDIVALMAKIDQEYTALIAKRADLRYQRGILEREGAASDLESKIAALHVELSSTGSQDENIRMARSHLDDCRLRLREADSTLSEARARRLELEMRLATATELLESSPDYQWLRTGPNSLIPSARYDRAESIRRITTLGEALKRLQAAIDAFSQSAARIRNAVQVVADSIGKAQVSTNPEIVRLLKHYEQIFAALLRDSEIQEVLFGGGTFNELDLLHAELSWTSSNEELLRRPVEAFSSGERAFAYVLASVLQHTTGAAENRILILDEFGAFIEADRLDRLLRFLDQQVLRQNRADQVVIMLPLRQTGSEGGDRSVLLEAVEKQGYFAQEVVLP